MDIQSLHLEMMAGDLHKAKFSMEGDDLKSEFFFTSLLIVCISLPFMKNGNSWAIGLLAVSSLFTNGWKDKLRRVGQQRWIWLFVVYYSLHLFAIMYTENLPAGFFILEKKSGMWLLPLILASAPPLTPERWGKIRLAFVVACTAGITVCLARGCYLWLVRGTTAYLSHHELSSAIGMHAVYFSAYLAFCVFILLDHARDHRYQRTTFTRMVWIIWVVYLILGIFLLASKTIILVFLLIGCIGGPLLIAGKRRLKEFAVCVAFLLVSAFVLYSIPKTRERFRDALNTEFKVLSLEKYAYNTPLSGISLRLVIWKYTLRIIAEEKVWITGTGPGDSQDRLDRIYEKIGLYTGNPNFGDKGYLGYNVHNQILQSWLELGLPGLIVTLGLFVSLLLAALHSGNNLFSCFLLLLVAFALTESIFETHHGSVFFTLFSALFMVRGRPRVADA